MQGEAILSAKLSESAVTVEPVLAVQAVRRRATRTRPQQRHARGHGVNDETAASAVSGGELDERTIAAARRRDHIAFAAVVAHYEDRLRVLAYQHLQDRDLAQDAVQDAFVKAYQALSGFKGHSSLGTWLHRITYNTCVDYQRRRGRRRETPSQDGWQPGVSDDANESFVARSDVARALAALPVEQRLTVLLVDREGFDYRTVAEIMSTSPGTVCSRLNRARRALRRVLAPPEASACKTLASTKEGS